MSLLEFARGPGMALALAVFVVVITWRLVGIALLRGHKDLSEPRNRAAWKGLRLIALRSWPRREFLGGSAFSEITGYTFHIGFLLILFFYVPHIKVFADALAGLSGGRLRIGAGWPSLPAGVASAFAAIALTALLVVLLHRLVNPVKRLISNFDDYFSVLMTAAPLATGLVAHNQVGAAHYDTVLAVHLLTVDALLIWFPCGKLIHAFTIFAARGTTGVLFERKGAAL
jgi:nitrate reductase gamma subunit